MTRYVPIVLLSLVLNWAATACAPKLVGPTPTKGYFVSLQVLDPIIYVASSSFYAQQEIRKATLVVRVQNAQGQPINDVPVVFEVAPEWTPYGSVTPSHTTTRDGMARTVFESNTIGVARITARVDGLTQDATVAVQNRPNPTSHGGV